MARVPETHGRRIAGTDEDTPEAKEIRHQRALKAAASRKVGRDEKKRVYAIFLDEEETEIAGRRYRLWQQMMGMCTTPRTNPAFDWPPAGATPEKIDEMFAQRVARAAALPKPKSVYEAAEHFAEFYRPFLVEFLPASKIMELYKSLLTRRRESISTLWLDNFDAVVMSAIRDKIEDYLKSRGALPPSPADEHMANKAAERAARSAGKPVDVGDAAEPAAPAVEDEAAYTTASSGDEANDDDGLADEKMATPANVAHETAPAAVNAENAENAENAVYVVNAVNAVNEEMDPCASYADAVAALTAMRAAAVTEIAAMRASAVAEIAAARAAAVAEITAMLAVALRRPAPHTDH